jgi:hypothetical protein
MDGFYATDAGIEALARSEKFKMWLKAVEAIYLPRSKIGRPRKARSAAITSSSPGRRFRRPDGARTRHPKVLDFGSADPCNDTW